MAPAETTAKPKQPEPPKVDDKPETAQQSSPDQSTDPAMEETLRATPSNLEYVSTRAQIKYR